MKLKRNFAILIWISGFIKDLKERNLRIKNLCTYFSSLFRVIFCRYKYIGINTKWNTEWYWIVGGKNFENQLHYSTLDWDIEDSEFDDLPNEIMKSNEDLIWKDLTNSNNKKDKGSE